MRVKLSGGETARRGEESDIVHAARDRQTDQIRMRRERVAYRVDAALCNGLPQPASEVLRYAQLSADQTFPGEHQ